MILIGWLGALLLSICGLPEAYMAIKTLECKLTWSFLALWGFGEVFSLVFVVTKNSQFKLLPLIVNYGFNLLFIIIMVIIKLGVI